MDRPRKRQQTQYFETKEKQQAYYKGKRPAPTDQTPGPSKRLTPGTTTGCQERLHQEPPDELPWPEDDQESQIPYNSSHSPWLDPAERTRR